MFEKTPHKFIWIGSIRRGSLTGYHVASHAKGTSVRKGVPRNEEHPLVRTKILPPDLGIMPTLLYFYCILPLCLSSFPYPNPSLILLLECRTLTTISMEIPLICIILYWKEHLPSIIKDSSPLYTHSLTCASFPQS
jgi:hypothetical protein